MSNQNSNHIPSSITMDQNTANQRLDRFLRKYFRQYPDISLVMIFKAIRKGQIKVEQGGAIANETKGSTAIHNQQDGLLRSSQGQNKGKSRKVDQSYSLKLGDTIIFHQSFLDLISHKNPVEKKRAPLSTRRGVGDEVAIENIIISEDDNRLVINKPAGITIHPGQKAISSKSLVASGKKTGTSDKRLATSDQNPLSLYDLIKQYYSSRGFAGSMFQPNVAYRLDKNTSGLVIVAKTYAGLQHLNAQIRDRKVDKMYYTIVVGTFPKQLTCNKPMKKIVDKQFGRGKIIICNPSDTDAQEAHTIGYVEKTRSDSILGPLSLVKVKITTGRMHQIRVHLADAGYPVLGDIVYGLPSFNRKLQKNHNILRQCLHCRCYSFSDMDGKMVSFEAPLLDDMKKLIG